MKTTCPQCQTSYNVDDAKISEKGLLVKCSVCGNKYRIFKEQSKLGDENNLAEINGQTVGKGDDLSSNGSGNLGETGASASSSGEDRGELFESNSVNGGESPSDDNLNGGSVDDGGDFRVVSSQNEPQSDSADFFADSLGVSFEKTGASGDFAVSNDRFDSDSLFDDVPAPKRDNDSLFGDEGDLNFGSAGDKKGGEGVSLDDIFNENPADDAKNEDKNLKQSTDDFLKDLFGEGEPQNQFDGLEGGKIYFKNRESGKIFGPVMEEEVDDLISQGVVSRDDEISRDGTNWEDASFISGSLQTEEKTSGGKKLDLAFDEDSMDSLLFEEGTAIISDSRIQALESGEQNGEKSGAVDRVYIPEDFSEPSVESVSQPLKRYKRKRNAKFFYITTSVLTIAIIALIGGIIYYFNVPIKNWLNKRNSGDVLQNISESIAVNTGTLVDVREALNKDFPEDYINSIGILKQYIKPDSSAPSAVGLDGQIKFNLLISYNKRVEPSSLINDKIETSLKDAPGNIDLIKAKALYLYEIKQYDKAAALLQPFAEKNDQEIFYILGLLARAKNDSQQAESFFNTGFIQGGGKSMKIMYALANMKYENGDAQSATAFLNRIIIESPNYLKAYLLKAKILMNAEAKLLEAASFLKSIDPNIIAKAEDFQKAEYYQMIAAIAHKRGLTKEAIAFYEKSIEINKNDVNVITTIADFYVQISNSTKALEYYDMALKIDPKHPRSVVGKTEIYILLNQKEKIYLELAKLDIPSISDAALLARIGKIYYSMGDKAKALDFNDMAIKADPSYVEAYLSKAVILLDFNQVKELGQIADLLGKLGKEHYSYHLVKAIIDHEEANYQKATKQFAIAMEKNSVGDERVYFYYGKFLIDQQKYGEASKMLATAHKISPRNYEYLQTYAESLEKERKWQAVINLLEPNSFMEKRMYKSYSTLANAFFYTQKYEKALTSVNKALELNSQNSYIFYLKAKIYYAMERYPEAEKEIDTAVILDMKNFDNYMMFARILSKRGDFKGAIEKIEAAEKIDPSDQDLMLMKGVVYKNLDDYHNALQYFKKVTNKSLIKEAYLEIGESYLQLGKTKKALNFLIKAEKSGNKAAYKHIAKIHYEAGRLNEAITYYRKALRNDKNNSKAMKQLGYIYKEKGEIGKAISYLNSYLKKTTEPFERQMIADEVFYLRQNLPKGKTAKVVENIDEYDENDLEALNERAKELYIEGRALREEDPDLARERFKEIMRIVPKTNQYYRKAFKAFNKLNSESNS